jgi:hypothetical protein
MLLTGCFGSQPEPRVEYRDRITEVKVTIPAELLICDTVDVNPDDYTLQSQVAELLNVLTSKLNACSTNMESIRKKVETE